MPPPTTAPAATHHSSDPAVFDLIAKEAQRQETTLELIASENHTSPAVMAAMGSCLTNKYAEGYPGARYYGGCVFHDQIEQLAIDRAKAMFSVDGGSAKFANVQPHSGAQANAAVFMALMEPGATFLSLVLKDGGHLSHGMKINFSGRYYNPVHYPLHYTPSHPEFECINYDAMKEAARLHRPKVIMCGYSAYPRTIDFAKFREAADEVGALLVADVAHIAGLAEQSDATGLKIETAEAAEKTVARHGADEAVDGESFSLARQHDATEAIIDGVDSSATLDRDRADANETAFRIHINSDIALAQVSFPLSHAAAADTSNIMLEAKRDASNANHQLRGQIVMMTMVFEQLDSMRGPAN
jgi:hypothetical protein